MASLSCKANSSDNNGITYEWKRVEGLLDDSKVHGVTTPTLTIPSVTLDDEDEYYCTASYGVYRNETNHTAKSERARISVVGKQTHTDTCTIL